MPDEVPRLPDAPSVSKPRIRRPKRELTKSEKFIIGFRIFGKAILKVLVPIGIVIIAFIAIIFGVVIGEVGSTIKKTIN